MTTLYLKPARVGNIIRDPVTYRPLAADGERKPRNLHWLRKLTRGEVIETVPLTPDAAPASEPASRRKAKE